jgi:hypothetical protein
MPETMRRACLGGSAEKPGRLTASSALRLAPGNRSGMLFTARRNKAAPVLQMAAFGGRDLLKVPQAEQSRYRDSKPDKSGGAAGSSRRTRK